MEAARQQYEAAQERRRAAVPGAAGGARPRRARAQGAGRHRRPRAVRRRGRASGSCRSATTSRKGMKVAVVVRVNPLRVQLTVPEQFVSAVAVGQPVTFEVDAYPGRAVHREGALRLARAAGRSARAHRRSGRPEPERRAEAGTVRDRAHRAAGRDAGACWCRPRGADRRRHEPRLRRQRRPRRRADRHDRPDGRRLVEITNGLKAGERVATKNVAQLADGAQVSYTGT